MTDGVKLPVSFLESEDNICICVADVAYPELLFTVTHFSFVIPYEVCKYILILYKKATYIFPVKLILLFLFCELSTWLISDNVKIPINVFGLYFFCFVLLKTSHGSCWLN